MFHLQQFKFVRKLIGGDWIKVSTHITYGSFWTKKDKWVPCCGSRVHEYESY